MPARFRLPPTAHNPISLVGIAMATAMAWLFLALLIADLFGYVPNNPYIGLLLFVAIPAAFVIGLLLIPFGAWRVRRRAPDTAHEWPVLDLRDPRQRSLTVTVLALTFVNVLIVSIAAFGSVHYMETTEFCGTTCHTTMEPQYVAHGRSAHAQVACVRCHVGPGAGALIESKINGTRQLVHVLTSNVPKPVPPPSELISTARETCEGCHWPERFAGDRTRVIREFGNDEKNTETDTTLQLHVGGGSRRRGIGTGIHWHMNLDNEIEFVRDDARPEVIPYVRLRDRAGNVREYFGEGATPAQIAAGRRQRMDCMDCHNRPAHTFAPGAARAIDDAMAQGLIPRELPFARREAIAAVRAEYADHETAMNGIATHLRDFYRTRAGTDAALLNRAIAGAQDAWGGNVFPAMKVTWGTYPSNIGHVDSPGCFRCHDDSHKTKDGARTISQDCELCHTIQ
ncbi:MAG TPA: NapC/NirT family cytochrome c [Vicinamibacterales bacterium]|nr:NapC/NirT family cytochrome c [Vicinamibacterales bacterium]